MVKQVEHETRAPTRHTMLGNSDMRRHNLAAVMHAVLTSVNPSRSTVARRTGLTRTAASALVGQLLDRGVLVEDEPQPSRVGRPTATLRLAGDRFASVTVEIQSAGVSTVVNDLDGAAVAAWREPTHGLGPDDLLSVVITQARAALTGAAEAGKAPLAVVVAIHGAVEPAGRRILWSRDPRWQQLDVGAALREVSGSVPVIVENDATVAAIAELHAVTRAAPIRNLISISSDLGIGAGVIIDGRPYRGSHGFAGELGHMVLDPSGPECNCGRFGCWTAYVGLRNVFRRALPEAAAALETLRGYEDSAAGALLAAARNADERTLSTLQDAGVWLGRGVANIVNAFDPAVVVLGGYLVPLSPWILEPARSELAARALPQAAADCLTLTTIGPDRVSRGGARLALERLVDDPLAAPSPGDSRL